MIIGVAGTIASGKGELGNILVERGFKRLSLSDEIRDMMRKKGMDLTRDSLTVFADSMRKSEGAGFWARRIISKMIPGANYVIESIRNPAEVEEFRKIDGFFLVGVDAPVQLRFERTAARAREQDPQRFTDFLMIDARDRGVGQQDYGQQNARVLDMTDLIIMNDGTIEDFRKKVLFFLERLQKD